MFLIPLAKPFDWRHPPLMTLLIVLANVLVLSVWQAPRREGEHAFSYYYRSGLAEIELQRYATYLAQRHDVAVGPVARALSGDRSAAAEAVYLLQTDAEFLRLLHAGQVIPPGDPDYAKWRERRVRFDELLAKDFDWQHAFVPAVARWDTWLSHMFMHADWGHLIGNMIVLLLVGVVVEQVLGWWRYLLLYVIGGVGAAGVFMLFNLHSPVPLLGASGAVSGVSGMYAAIFGLRKINFFYFAFVYFDYVRAPAIVMLGLWLANEVFQQVTNAESHIAYLAHVGGLLTGAGLIGLLRLARDGRVERFLAEETGEETDRRELERAMALAEAMQLDEAAAILDQLTARRPDDYELLVEAYQVARQVPANAAYHRIAARVLALDAGNRAVLEMVAETFREYLQTARPRPHLTVTRAVALAETFAAADMLPESERLGEMIAKQKELRPEMAAALVAIGAALVKAGQRERARRWLDLVKSSLPGSPHADRAQALLMRP